MPQFGASGREWELPSVSGLVERTSGVTVEAGLGVDLHVNGGS